VTGCRSTPDCADPDDVLATRGEETLRCGEATEVVEWIELVAGRDLTAGDVPVVRRAVASSWNADAGGTRAWLTEVGGAKAAIAAGEGLAGAEARAAAVYAASKGGAPVGPDRPELASVLKRALAVWVHHDGDRLALTEADFEAWIRYASLCREAQGASTLRISVADRVAVYGMLADRFATGTRDDRIAMSAVGGYWPAIREAWIQASYEEQRDWIAAAPLPPPMTATSLGYAEAVFGGDVAAHARIAIEHLGPFTVGAVP
jgi:hypothetical protein